MKSIFELSSFSLLCGDTLEHSDFLGWNLTSFFFTFFFLLGCLHFEDLKEIFIRIFSIMSSC